MVSSHSPLAPVIYPPHNSQTHPFKSACVSPLLKSFKSFTSQSKSWPYSASQGHVWFASQLFQTSSLMPVLLRLLQLCWPHAAPQILLTLLPHGLCTCGSLCPGHPVLRCLHVLLLFWVQISAQVHLDHPQWNSTPVMSTSPSCCTYFIASFTTWHNMYLFLYCLSWLAQEF